MDVDTPTSLAAVPGFLFCREAAEAASSLAAAAEEVYVDATGREAVVFSRRIERAGGGTVKGAGKQDPPVGSLFCSSCTLCIKGGWHFLARR